MLDLPSMPLSLGRNAAAYVEGVPLVLAAIAAVWLYRHRCWRPVAWCLLAAACYEIFALVFEWAQLGVWSIVGDPAKRVMPSTWTALRAVLMQAWWTAWWLVLAVLVARAFGRRADVPRCPRCWKEIPTDLDTCLMCGQPLLIVVHRIAVAETSTLAADKESD